MAIDDGYASFYRAEYPHVVRTFTSSSTIANAQKMLRRKRSSNSSPLEEGLAI